MNRSLFFLAFIAGITDLLMKIAMIYLVIGLGVLWRFNRFYKPEYSKWFTQVAIWIFFPITILVSVLGVQSIDSSVFLGLGLLATVIHVVSYLAILVIVRYKQDDLSAGAQALAATFPNSLLYPFPIILATVGDIGLVYATFYVFFVMLLRNTFGVYVGVRHSPDYENGLTSAVDIRRVIVDMVKFPPFIATVAGFIIVAMYGSQDLSSPVIQVVKDISLWGSLILIGLSFQSLSQLKARNLFSRKTLEVSLVRFIISPVAGGLFIIAWQFQPIIAFTCLIQVMGPPAISNILYGKFFEIAEDEISVYITSVTFIGLLILPLELIILSVLFPF
ncbi:MAG: AEC family transporter [Candidatus Odinarchaeota archaeon]